MAIEGIALVGIGAPAAELALWWMKRGHRVVFAAAGDGTLQEVQELVERQLSDEQAQQRLSGEERLVVRRRLELTQVWADFLDADLGVVALSAAEDAHPWLKRLDACISPKAPLCVVGVSQPLADLAAATRRADRVFGLEPNPDAGSVRLERLHHSDDGAVEEVLGFIEALGMVPEVVRHGKSASS